MRTRVFAALLTMLFFASSIQSAEAAGGATGNIVYVSHRKGLSQLRIVKETGAGDKLVLSEKSKITYLSPVWSPDKKKIAFSRLSKSSDTNSANIYIIKPNGTGLKKLTSSPGADLNPSWSPDGKKIVFDSNRDGESRLYIMDANGKNQTRLTDSNGIDSHPSWSPDGTTIAFSTNRTPERFTSGMGAINADGSNYRLLVYTTYSETDASWSPDGTRIAFSSFRDQTGPGQWSSWEIYVMNSDGSGQTRLTYDLTRFDLHPSWSPDGTKLVWESRAGSNNSQLNIMNSDGSGQRKLSLPAKFSHGEPNWR